MTIKNIYYSYNHSVLRRGQRYTVIIPTQGQQVFLIHRKINEQFRSANLLRLYFAFITCFRRKASCGKLNRQQFSAWRQWRRLNAKQWRELRFASKLPYVKYIIKGSNTPNLKYLGNTVLKISRSQDFFSRRAYRRTDKHILIKIQKCLVQVGNNLYTKFQVYRSYLS